MNTTQLRPQVKTQIEWPAVFPEQATQTYCSSAVFMKQLTLVAVSTIVYLKNALPEDSFTTDVLAGTPIRILKSNSEDDLGRFLYKALSQAFEAFEKQYLQQLVLCFYSGECSPENLVECHMFEYQYRAGAVTMSVSCKSRDTDTSFNCDMADVKERTVMLIRSCMVMMQTCRSLPDTYDVSIRLYYTDAAPPGYQPTGFRAVPADSPAPAGSGFDHSRLGTVTTPYHCLLLTSFVNDTCGDSASASNSASAAASREALASQTAPQMTPTQALEQDYATSGDPISSAASSGQFQASLRCVCPSQHLIESPLLVCHYCKRSQHATCYGVLPEHAARVRAHACVECGDGSASDRDRDGKRPVATDRMLREHPPSKRACVAVYRNTIAWCASLQSFSIKELSTKLKLTEHSATKLVKSLANTGIVPTMPANQDRLTTRMKIDRKCLSKAIKEYFVAFEDDDLVSRLMEETLASQEIQPDPIGEVLGPMKQVSLQNTSKIGRVINSADVNNNNNNDPTLKMYKDALVNINKDIDMDLVLSGSSNPVRDFDSAGKKRKNDSDENNRKMGVVVKKVKTSQKAKRN